MTVTARKFSPADGEFCFKIRAGAFIIAFRHELDPEVSAACVNAYMPADYVRMSTESEMFIVEDGKQAVGFFTLKRTSHGEAEIPLIYLRLDRVGKGIGTWCIHYIQDWVATHWPEVHTLFLDTIIPKYNGGFYRRVGFEEVGRVMGTSAGAAKVRAHRALKVLREQLADTGGVS